MTHSCPSTCDLALTNESDLPYHATQCFYHALLAHCPACVVQHFGCLQQHHKQHIFRRVREVLDNPRATLTDLDSVAWHYKRWEHSPLLYKWLCKRQEATAGVMEALLPLLPPVLATWGSVPTWLVWFGPTNTSTFQALCDRSECLYSAELELLLSADIAMPEAHTRLLAARLRSDPTWALFWGIRGGIDCLVPWSGLSGDRRRQAQQLLQHFETRFGEGMTLAWDDEDDSEDDKDEVEDEHSE